MRKWKHDAQIITTDRRTAPLCGDALALPPWSVEEGETINDRLRLELLQALLYRRRRHRLHRQRVPAPWRREFARLSPPRFHRPSPQQPPWIVASVEHACQLRWLVLARLDRAAALVFRKVSIRFIIASISVEQGPAKVADIDAANATVLNANNVAIFMAATLLTTLLYCALIQFF